jgi:hypothetical protein
LAYQMTAERENEKAQSRNASLFIAVAKARVFASEGWQVVVTDDSGRAFTPAEFEQLCSFDAQKPRLPSLDAPVLAEAAVNEPQGDVAKTTVESVQEVASLEAPSATQAFLGALESARSQA